MREVLKAGFQLEDSNPEEGTFRGLASVFNTPVDAYVPTFLVPGAFKKTLKENASRVRILYQHDDSRPIGRPTSMVESAIGLEVAGKISATRDGNDTRTLMRDEVITDLSIGFDPMVAEMIERSAFEKARLPENILAWAMDTGVPGLRRIKEVRLWEFSPVTWGANEPAKIKEVYAALRGEALPAPAVITDDQAIELILAAVRNEGSEKAGLYAVGPLLAFCETHTGKELSAEHQTLAQDALSALHSLLIAAEPQDDGEHAAAALTVRQSFMEAQLRLVELEQRLAA